MVVGIIELFANVAESIFGQTATSDIVNDSESSTEQAHFVAELFSHLMGCACSLRPPSPFHSQGVCVPKGIKPHFLTL